MRHDLHIAVRILSRKQMLQSILHIPSYVARCDVERTLMKLSGDEQAFLQIKTLNATVSTLTNQTGQVDQSDRSNTQSRLTENQPARPVGRPIRPVQYRNNTKTQQLSSSSSCTNQTLCDASVDDFKCIQQDTAHRKSTSKQIEAEAQVISQKTTNKAN